MPGRNPHGHASRAELWAQGTARVGEHYGVKRVPVIKKQAISAYDPRVVEATGITMMATAQGADHTAGNLPRLKDKRDDDWNSCASSACRIRSRPRRNDSLGLCIFGRSVTNAQCPFMMNAINASTGSNVDDSFFFTLGREALTLEHEFNSPGRV